MQKVFDFFHEHEKLVTGAAVSLLAGYLLLRNQIWNNSNSRKGGNLLDVTLSQLIANRSHARIKKIVITASPSSKG